MLEYISEEKCRLDPGALRFYDGEFDLRTAQINLGAHTCAPGREYAPLQITGVAVYWDPSGGRARGDSSVCVIVYRDDKNRRAFIHDVRYMIVQDNDPHPLATQCETVLDFMQTHGAKKIAIEVNGMGNALPEILRDAAVRRGQSVIVEKIINHQRKETRILDAIEPLLTTGRLYTHERVKSSPLLVEMLGWSPMAVGGHDDGLDAVAGCLRLVPAPVRALGASLRPINAKTEFRV